MRRTAFWAGVVLGFSPVALAQQANQQPAPALQNVLGPQLVAWSELQQLRPVPQPLPRPEPDPPATELQPHPTQQTQQPPDSHTPEVPNAQSFTGTIVKDGSKYVLKVSGSVAYQIDCQETAQPYEGKQVKVSGSVDSRSINLHVTSIGLL